MSREIKWFKFTSEREERKKKAHFNKTIFPLGEEFQKEKEYEIVASLFDYKISFQEVIFNLVCVKQALLEEEKKDILEDLHFWHTSPSSSIIKKKDKPLFISAAELLLNVKAVEEFPTKEDIAINKEKILENYGRELKLI